MFNLLVHENAVADLREIAKTCPGAVGKILATFEQIKADPTLIDALTIDKFGEDQSEIISIRSWVEQWQSGHNLWRMKIWGLEENGQRYRILYAFDPVKLQLHILAVVRRAEFNYEPDHKITIRILEVYSKLGIRIH